MAATLYRDPVSSVVVVDGPPPVDQSAQVAALIAERDALQATLDAARDRVAAMELAWTALKTVLVA